MLTLTTKILLLILTLYFITPHSCIPLVNVHQYWTNKDGMTYSALEQKYNSVFLCFSGFHHGCTFKFKVNFPHSVNVGTGYYIDFNVTSNNDGCTTVLCSNNVSIPSQRETCSFGYNSLTMGDLLQISSQSKLATGPILNVSWEVRLSGCPNVIPSESGNDEKRDIVTWYKDALKPITGSLGICEPAPTSVPFIEVWDPTPKVQKLDVTSNFFDMDSYAFVICGSSDPTGYDNEITLTAQAKDPNTALTQWGCLIENSISSFCPPVNSDPIWSNPNPSPLNRVTQVLQVPEIISWTVRAQGQVGIKNEYMLSMLQNPVSPSIKNKN